MVNSLIISTLPCYDAPQAPHIDGAGGQSGRIGFLLAPWNSHKKMHKHNTASASHTNDSKLDYRYQYPGT